MEPTRPTGPNFPQIEQHIADFWEREKIFEQSVKAREGREPFVIYDGPPTANAKPALHHTLPAAFKDVAGRYKTMQGYYVPRQSGWDTHGLPVEVQVERALGLSSKKDVTALVPGDEKASIAMFNKACRESVWQFKQEWDKFLPRLGYWLDQEHPYITYDSGYIEGVWSVVKQVFDGGHIFKDYKVLPYCPRCGTGLSAAEVAQGYEDVKDTSVYVKFALAEKPQTFFLAWTTTPWTLPGNVALAVGPDIEYVEVLTEVEGIRETYILAKARLGVLVGDYEIVNEYKGSDLTNFTYRPLYEQPLTGVEGRKFCVVPASFVTTDDGTGIVHTAVMYGEDDFLLGKEAGLARVHTVSPDGTFNELVPEFQGMFVRDALVPILKDLIAKGALYKKESVTHSYPHCWRCKTPLIYYAKDSWYIGMSKVRSELVRINDGISWIPDHVREGRFGDFIREARDWAISRERFWGTPLPIWVSPSGKLICVGSLAELKSLAKNPELISDAFDPHRPFIDEIILIKDGEEYVREPYVLDVWLDSGSMPYASGRAQEGLFPADYIAEGVDQTRGWFYSLLALSTLIKGESAYKRVVCFGHLVDEHGKKMSKSVGNIIDPWTIFNEYGADALRWYLFTLNAPGETKAFSVKDLQTAFRNTHMLLFNVVNYYHTYSQLAGHSKPTPTQREATRGSATNMLDRWMLSRMAAIRDEVTEHLDAFDFLRAGRAIEQYVGDLSTWYLRRSRGRTDEAFFTVLYDASLLAVYMLAPLTPFLTEDLYQGLRADTDPVSVHVAEWPPHIALSDSTLEQQIAMVRKAVELGLSVRAEHKVKVRQPLQEVVVNAPQAFTDEMLAMLMDELNVLSARNGGEAVGFASSRIDQELGVMLDLRITDSLAFAGLQRDWKRTVQSQRKEAGLMPGEQGLLLVAPQHIGRVREVIGESLTELGVVLQEDPQVENELDVSGETILMTVTKTV